jgi:hypothetical protein
MIKALYDFQLGSKMDLIWSLKVILKPPLDFIRHLN